MSNNLSLIGYYCLYFAINSYLPRKTIPADSVQLGHLFFNLYSQTIDIWSTYSETKCKTVFDFLQPGFREKLSWKPNLDKN